MGGAPDSICAFCDLWKASIEKGPAPLPEDGPPFSAHATRDRRVLPYEVVGVVGAYVVSVLLLGTLLLTVGRSLRKRAQSMARGEMPTELVQPMSKQFDLSPISPIDSRSWYSPTKFNTRSAISSIRSGNSTLATPAMDSVVSFDAKVVEADRQRRQEEMERLYAAVMEHDDRKSQTQTPVQAALPPEYQRQQRARRPPNLITDAPALRHLPTPQQPLSFLRSPGTPKSPEYARHFQQQTDDIRRSPASSLPSIRSPASEHSLGGRKHRKSLRNVKISAPLRADDQSEGARTPLSPRSYMDPGIPPEPPTARTVDTTNTVRTEDSYGYPPRHPGTARDHRFDAEREKFEEAEEDLDEIRDLPRAHPNRLSTYAYNNQPQAITNAASQRSDPTGPIIQNKTPAAPTTRALPLRQLTAAQAAYPLSPSTWNQPASAGPGRTQFVERRRDLLSAPRTGMATPYSPYMPFTPVTPVTLSLPTRMERRQREREERQVRGPITEEDQVADEKELWSSGY